MRSKPIGLDWFDLLLHGGITFALAVVGASAMRSQEEFAIGMVVAVSLGVLGWRRGRALRRAPALTTGEAQVERVAELEARVADLESQHSRVLELEERLDFAERLLAQERGPARIPGDRASS